MSPKRGHSRASRLSSTARSAHGARRSERDSAGVWGEPRAPSPPVSPDHDCVVGFHAIEAVVARSPRRLRSLYCDVGRLDQRAMALVDAARCAGARVERVPRDALDAIVASCHGAERGAPIRHQGVVAEVVAAQVLDEHRLGDLLPTARLVLVLDGVTDPHNLGACLRSAAAAGADAVVQPRAHSAPLNAVARRVAAGAAECVPLFAVANLARTLERLRAEGFWSVGLDGGASVSLFELDWPDRTVLVVGDEGRGLRARTRSLCDHQVAIPMAGGIESLNVSVATGIALFEWRRLHPVSARA